MDNNSVEQYGWTTWIIAHLASCLVLVYLCSFSKWNGCSAPSETKGSTFFKKLNCCSKSAALKAHWDQLCTSWPPSHELAGSPPNMGTTHGKFYLHVVSKCILKVTLGRGLLQLCIHCGLKIHSGSELESDFKTLPTFLRLCKVITCDLCIMCDLCFEPEHRCLQQHFKLLL